MRFSRTIPQPDRSTMLGTVMEQAHTTRPPLWAYLGTVVFTIMVPGSVVGLVPYLISRWALKPPLFGLGLTRWIGLGIFVIAVPPFADFLGRFVREGHGTPAPIAPTRRLVIGGVYRRVRNPAYIAVIAMLVGQALFFGNLDLFEYAFAVAIGFHFFVILYEEPTLRRTFGRDYQDYCRSVPRWVPRLRPDDRGDQR
ncbi:methyltransferase family protein [Candidatus Binatus sp.]|uniref:methyltransferase family protein n=1 Tax=Candidatus Binatus sp. TaxID=2811406 RepID=UPI003F9D5547